MQQSDAMTATSNFFSRASAASIVTGTAMPLRPWAHSVSAYDKINVLTPAAFPLDAASDLPIWCQLLAASALLCAFGAAVSATERAEEVSNKVVSMVRVDAIAFRLATVAGLCGAHGLANALPSDSQFPLTDMHLDVPAWVQFVVASVLLAIFAAVVQEDAATEESNTASNTVSLVRLDAIAWRLAAVAGLCGMHGAARNLPTMGDFSSTEFQLDAPVWMQLAAVSVLLAIFAAVVREAEATDEQTLKPVVNLVSIDGIALRLSCAAGAASTYFAACSAVQSLSWVPLAQVGGAELAVPQVVGHFPSVDANLDVPSWGLCLVASVLLAVFAAIVQEDVAKDQEEAKTVRLVRPEAIAWRLAAAAGLKGLHGAVSSLPTISELPLADLQLDAPVWMQLFAVCALLAVFAAVVREAEAAEEASKPAVNLVSIDGIAVRLSCAAGVAGMYFAAPSASHCLSLVPSIEFGGAAAIFGDAELDVPCWVLSLVAAALLAVFAAVVQEDIASDEEKCLAKTVNLVRLDAIVLKFALAAGMYGTYGAACSLSLPTISSFPLADVEIDSPVWLQLLSVSVLLAIFAAIVKEAETADEVKPAVNLVRVDGIASRMSFATAAASIYFAVSSVTQNVSFGPAADMAQVDALLDVPDFLPTLSGGPSVEMVTKGALLILATVLTVTHSKGAKDKLA